MNNPYILYIDGMEIPITPSKIKNKRDGQNETYSLLNGETFTALRKSKLESFSFSFYAFSKEHEGVALFTSQQEIIEKFEELKKEKIEFEFSIIRTTSDPNLRNSICKHMTLEDYSIDEDSKYGTNIIITLDLQEYMPLKTIKLEDSEIGKDGSVTVKTELTEKVEYQIGVDVLNS